MRLLPSRRDILPDLFFLVQFGCGINFSVLQAIKAYTTSQGINMSWYGLWEIFLLLNLVLSWRAYQAKPTRTALQVFIIYVMWTVSVTVIMVEMVACKTASWDRYDWITTGITFTGVLAVLGLAWRRNLTIGDPLVKGRLAAFFKGVPQLALAWKVFVYGKGGLDGGTVVFGHITVLSRIIQITISQWEAKSEQNRKGSALGEYANELSWIVVTVVWFLKF